jgi:hypothetical protein
MRYLLLTALLTGCAAEVYTHRYEHLPPKLTVYRGSQSRVDGVCLDNLKEWDDGQKVMHGQHVDGCYFQATGSIWIVNNESGAKAILHELCHADGKDRCEEYDW